MKAKAIFLLIFVVFCFSSYSQVKFTTKTSFVERHKMHSKETYPDYMPILINNPNKSANFEKPINNNEESTINKKSEFKTSKNVDMPFILAGFQDAYDSYSIPNDNTIAVSNSGYMVTMRNSKISFYNDTLGLIESQSLDAFTESLDIPYAKYDPRVIYDFEEDRFIVVMLSGYYHDSNEIIICFSSSDNPEDEWYFYTIPGNYLNDDTWSDFPIIAVNQEELFITVTNFADMDNWDTWDFYGCRIIQMDKFAAYNGDETVGFAYHIVEPGFAESLPSTIYYYNVTPVKSGKTMYGPHMYFVSTLDCPYQDPETEEWPSNDTVFLVKFSGTYDSPDFDITSTYLESPVQYGLSIETPQPYGHALKTNYNTIKNAFIANNIIHFVLNSIDYNNNQAGFMYGRIYDPEGECNLECDIISSDTMGIAYPSIAYVGENETDQRVIIGFNYTSENLFPGNACMMYDNGEYSDILVLKEGVGLMNMTSSHAERWGDYTTIQRKYNESDIVYFTGSYGSGGNTRSWVSKISVGENPQNIDQNEVYSPANVYPNPTSDFVKVEFTLTDKQICSFNLYDINGKHIAEIIQIKAKPGLNEFSFNITSLAKGTYILKINGNKAYTSEHKIIVQ